MGLTLGDDGGKSLIRIEWIKPDWPELLCTEGSLFRKYFREFKLVKRLLSDSDIELQE